jgi:hypothetical protein
MHKKVAKGGANKKMKKFPRILDYLEVHHPKISELIDDLAMHGNLTPRRGSAITFLIPDAKYLAEIKKVSESENPEDATDMISSLILLGLYTKPEDFKKAADDVPNLLGKKLTGVVVHGNEVKINNGTLTLDTKFRPFSRQGKAPRGNMAIWNLKGEVEYKTAPESTKKHDRRSKDEKEGGSVGGDSESDLRGLFASIVQAKVEAIRSDRKSDDGKVFCPLVNAITKLLRRFLNTDGGYYEEARRAKCILTMCPAIDVVLLFANPLVFAPDRVVAAYGDEEVDRDYNSDFYSRFYNDFTHPAFKDMSGKLMSKAGLADANAARDKLREQFVHPLTSKIGEQILAEYKKIDSTNSFGSTKDVYPEGLADVFHSHEGLHLLIDEVSYFLWSGLQYVKRAPSSAEKAAAFDKLFEDFVIGWKGDLSMPTKKTRMDKSSSYGDNLDSNFIYQYAVCFLKLFVFHVPSHKDFDMEDRVVVGSDEAENPYSKEMVDVDKKIMEDMQGYDNCPACLSNRAIAELKAYMRSHDGKMPELTY